MNEFGSTAFTKEDRTWGMLCHLSSLLLFIGIPFGNIIGPLVIWLIKRENSPFIDAHGKESLNFQISMTIYALISAVLVLVLLGIVMLIALAIADIILIIIASIKANSGENYTYPFTIRFVK